MRTAAPIVSERHTAGADLLWRPFADALPPERIDVLVGNPAVGTMLDVQQRIGSHMHRSATLNRMPREVGVGVGTLARNGEWWMLLPHVGPEN